MFNKEELSETDIIILEADGKIDDKNNGYGYPIKNRLAEMDINSKIISLIDDSNSNHLDELPPKPLIFSGGMTEVTKNLDWINECKAFIKGKIEENKNNKGIPIFGICFGAQLIAETYKKGSVMYLDTPEIGISKIKLNKTNHNLFKGFKKEFDAYSFHYNQIKTKDFSIISSTKINHNEFIQAFEIPNTPIFGVQFHPEFKINEMKTLLKIYEDLVKNLGHNINRIIENLPKIENNWLILKNFYYYFWRKSVG